MNQPAPFHWRIRVYYEDTDAGGIVYYANYLRFFERARTEWLRHLGVSHQQMAHEHGLQFVVRSLTLDYQRPARLDDELTLTLTQTAASGASMQLNQQAALAGTDEFLVGAQVVIACVRCTDGRPTRLPKWLMNRVIS